MAETGSKSSSLSGCPFHNLGWGGTSPWQQEQSSLLIALTAFIAAVGSSVWMHSLARRKRPGPKSWPLVGSVPVLMVNWHRLFDYLMEFFDGEGLDVFWVNLAGGVVSVYVAEPSIVEHMLKTNFANYPKGKTIIERMEEILGKGIFNSDHGHWKTQRKVASFEFVSSNLRDFSTVVYKAGALKLLRIISEFSEANRTMDMQDLFMRMTLDSTAKLGFGVELGCLSASLPTVPFATAFERANELSFHRYVDPFWNLKRALNIGEERELKNCLKVIDSFSYDVIRKRKEEIKTSHDLTKMKTKSDLLSRFMSLKEGDYEPYSEQALRDVILNFIIAGRDTTGVTLSWFTYKLCLHPEIAEKILEEIQLLEQTVGFAKEEQESGDIYSRFADLLTYQNLGKLHYLQAALSETLRLYPAVPLDGKTALADDILPNGAQVKKGDLVTYCSYAMGRLERVWGPDAKEFRPERWLKNGIFQPESPFKFVAFHAGPRSCLGRESAYLQMKMTAALLVRFFQFQLVPGHEVHYRVMFVLTMNNGLEVASSPRTIHHPCPTLPHLAMKM